MCRNLVIAALGITLMSSTAVLAQSECDSYVVAEGDTIRKISFIAYGEEDLFESLFAANRSVLSANAPAFAVGTEIVVPCYDDLDFSVLGSGIGNLAVASADVTPIDPLVGPALPEVITPSVEVATVEPEVVPEPVPEVVAATQGPIRFITGSDFKPFSDVSLENGGMFTELVATAVNRAEDGKEFAIDFQDDFSSHLEELLPGGEYDVSFPWYRPNCELGDKLSAEMQERCANFAWSEPYFEQIVAMYTRLGDPLVDAFTPFDLFGSTVCRPAQMFTYDLEEVDLVEPNVTFLQPKTAGECFEMLLSGEVDVVTLNAPIAEDTIKGMRVNAVVVEMEQMATIQTLHAIASRSNPDALEYLNMVNEGIAQMSTSGEWISIVNRHLENQ